VDAQAVRQVLNRPSAQPFALHLADGRVLDVPHPELMSISRSGRRVIVGTQDDGFEIIDVIMIVSIEIKPPSKMAA